MLFPLAAFLVVGFNNGLNILLWVHHLSFIYLCVLVAQSCPTFHDLMDCSPQGSSVHGILQARILEWVAIPFSRASSQPRDLLHCRQILYRLSHQESIYIWHLFKTINWPSHWRCIWQINKTLRTVVKWIKNATNCTIPHEGEK